MAPSAIAPALWIVFSIAAVFAIAFGVIYSYHWVRFSASSAVTLFSIILYVAGAGFFLMAMFASAIALSL